MRNFIKEASEGLFIILHCGEKAILKLPIKEGNRNNGTFQYACALHNNGVLREHAEVLIKLTADLCSPPFPHDEALSCLDSVWKYEVALDAETLKKIEELNKKHAAIMVRGNFYITTKTINYIDNSPDMTLSLVTDFRHLYRNQTVKVRTGKNTYKYLIAWMADILQNPANKPGTAIILYGNQGTGKTKAVELFGRILGQHFVPVSSPKMLVGNFNNHLKMAMLVLADEATISGDKKALGVLKTLITEDKMAIEPKGKDIIFVKNYMRIMAASNYNDAIDAALDERRFLMIEVSERKKQDTEYFGALINQMNNGGTAALCHFLLDLDISDINLRHLPQTHALREAKLLSLESSEQFIHERLYSGTWLDRSDKWERWSTTRKLYAAYMGYCQKMGIREKAQNHSLERL